MARRKREHIGEDIELHRLDGPTVSLGCESCHLLSLCGGNTRVGGGMCHLRCLECGNRDECDLVCLGKPEAFADAYMEVNGFGFDDIGSLVTPTAALPQYVPMIHNGSNRVRPLREEWAAVPLSEILLHPKGVPLPAVETPAELRERFKLQPAAQVILVGVDQDDEIERYWGWREGLPEKLAALGIRAAVVPNYSFSLRHPRPQHLFNRKRSLICAREWSEVGIATIPFLQAVTARDWQYWREFLESHPEVSVVAKEFQTGLARRTRGLPALHELARVQDALKRPLHLLAVGGSHYRDEFSRLLGGWTIVDSNPFIKAVHWRKARLEKYLKWDKAPDSRVDALLAHNIGLYRRWLATPFVPSEYGNRSPRLRGSYTGQMRLPGT